MMEGNRWWHAASYGYPAGFEIRRPVKSFWLTVCEVLVSPRTFYSRLEAGRSEYPAMVFLYLVGATAFLSASGVLLLTGNDALFEARFFGGGEQSGAPFRIGESGSGPNALWEALPSVVSLGLIAPVLLIVANYLWALLAHALAWFYMGRRAGNIKHTFRVIAYSNAVGFVALLLALLPLPLAPVATLWALYLLVIGVRRLNPRAAGYAVEESVVEESGGAPAGSRSG